MRIAVLIGLLLGAVWPTSALPYNPLDPSLPSRFLEPMSHDARGNYHLLGADFLGRDMLSRLLYSGRYSLVTAFAAALITTVAAVAFGISAGYLSGWYESLVMRVVDALLSLPVLLIAIVLAAIIGRGVFALAVILALTGWADYTRVIRAEALGLRHVAFVEASRTAGASTARILARDVLPNVVSTMSVMSTYLIARFMLLESSISFLGMGVVPPASSWGVMVGEGKDYIFEAPHVSVIPGLMITITVIAVNFVGDGLRDLLDPRGRRM
jgi:peptide/nickel transport system permease protein